jgi:hypothetical protein
MPVDKVASITNRSPKWRKTLDSVGKSLAISWMSEFLKVLPQLKLLSDEFLP